MQSYITRLLLISICLVFTFSLLGCPSEQKPVVDPEPAAQQEPVVDPEPAAQPDEEAALPEGHPPLDQPTATGPEMEDSEEKAIERKSRTVTVPESVLGKWQSVRLAIVFKETGKLTELSTSLGQISPIPGTDLAVEPLHFLPSFHMGQETITSLDNQLNNPAALIRIYETEKQIYQGWFFLKFPAVHPFEHQTVSIALAGAILVPEETKDPDQPQPGT